MAAVAKQQQDFCGATIQDVEEFLRHVKSWDNLATRLICILVGIFAAVYGAFTAVTREDRIVFSFISGVPLLLGIGLICWDAYLRVLLGYMLEQMQAAAAMDLESPGEQS